MKAVNIVLIFLAVSSFTALLLAEDKPNDFNGRLNGLITQLGDADYRMQKSAEKEIQYFIDNFARSVEADPEYDSPELDYLTRTIEYTARNGCISGTGNTSNPALQSRAIKLWASVQKGLIVNEDLIKLYPDILSKLGGDDEDIVSWLRTQDKGIQNKAVRLYKWFILSDNRSVRQEAISGLLELGLIKDVLTLFGNNDKTIQGDIRYEIIGRNDGSVTTELLRLMKGSDSGTRCVILGILGDKEETSIIKSLEPWLHDKDPLVRIATAEALWKLDKEFASSKMLNMLSDGDVAVRRKIILFLTELSDASPAIEKLLPFLEDGDEWIRLNAARVLLNWNDRYIIDLSTPFSSNIVSLLNHSDLQIRRDAIELVGQLGDDSRIDNLMPFLKDKDVGIQAEAIYAIGRISKLPDFGKYCTTTIKGAIQALGQEDKLNELEAIEILSSAGGSIAIKEFTLLPELLPLVKDKDIYIWQPALKMFLRFGGYSGLEQYSLTARFNSLLNNKDDLVREKVALAIGWAGDRKFIRYLLPLLKDKNTLVKAAAAWALTEMQDVRAVPGWMECLDSIEILYYKDEKSHHGISRQGSRIDNMATNSIGRLIGRHFGSDSKLWKDWWVKEGKAWYEEEVKKLAITDEH